MLVFADFCAGLGHQPIVKRGRYDLSQCKVKDGVYKLKLIAASARLE
jgi:hypothetical protein